MVLRTASVIAWWALVVACSGDGSGSGPVSSGVSAAQACADNAHARCIQLQSCSATDLQLRYGSESTCETRETDNCTTSLAEPLNGNTPAAVEACAGAYAGWACADYLNDTNIPPACQQQLGPIIDGGSCAIDGQCQSGFCAIPPGSSCGACSGVPKPGDSCAELTSCGPGLACTTDTVLCVAFGARGSACGKGALCGVGLSCVGADLSNGTQGTCRQAGETLGAPCDPTEQLGAGCDRNTGLACNSGAKEADAGPEGATEGGADDAGTTGDAGSAGRTCQAVIVASAGQPCGDDIDEQPVYCEADGVCTGASGTTPGTCTAAAADGAACNAATGPGCLIPARCIAGTCQYSGAQSCH